MLRFALFLQNRMPCMVSPVTYHTGQRCEGNGSLSYLLINSLSNLNICVCAARVREEVAVLTAVKWKLCFAIGSDSLSLTHHRVWGGFTCSPLSSAFSDGRVWGHFSGKLSHVVDEWLPSFLIYLISAVFKYLKYKSQNRLSQILGFWEDCTCSRTLYVLSVIIPIMF